MELKKRSIFTKVNISTIIAEYIGDFRRTK